MISSKVQAPSSKEVSSPIVQVSKKYDLNERTLKFALDVLALCKRLPSDRVNYELISQLVRSSTSIGANYREATEGLSKKDFCHRAGISRKEAKETHYWLEIVAKMNPAYAEEALMLANEAGQLLRIFATIVRNASV